MQVTKITEEHPLSAATAKTFTTEELQREYGYYMAQKLLESMLDTGLVSVDEFNKITELNRRYFSPCLAQIMPKLT